jgi:hypothetical protein
MGRLSTNEKKVIDYFKSKKYFKEGFLKFGYWNRRIKFILDNQITKYELKKLFYGLVSKKYFNSKKIANKVYLYQFTDKKYKYNIDSSKPIIITFD